MNDKITNAQVMVCSMHCAADLEELVAGANLEKRLRMAFRTSQTFWMTRDDDPRFRGAVAAVYCAATEEEKDLIKRSLVPVRLLDDAISGRAALDIVKLASMHDADLLPLLRWYKEEQARAKLDADVNTALGVQP